MFDKLVESTTSRPNRRTGRYFAVTCLIYGTVLVSVVTLGISRFSPVMAEEYDLLAKLKPPVPVLGKPDLPVRRTQVVTGRQPVAAVPRPIREVPIPTIDEIAHLTPLPFENRIPSVVGNGGGPGAISGGSTEGAPPPPPPTSKPVPKPDPTPEVKQGPLKVSIGVLQGKAIRKTMPAYPPIAKQARISGAVQVLVTISEEGQVIEATVLNGHPILRAAAEAAARQWLFSPTLLSNVPVKVQGVLTFNFTLN